MLTYHPEVKFMQKGFQNEVDFKDIIDKKKLYQLPTDIKEMLLYIFGNVDDKSYVQCWLSKYYEKADIKVKINGVVKGISIKSGGFSSIHQEHISKFYPFLLKIGVDDNVINKFNNYINGIVKGKRVSSSEYIENNSSDIDIIRKKFNEYYVKTNMIIRFIFQGTEIQKYDCDCLIYGTPNNFIWATKNEILKFLVDYEAKEQKFINISALNIKCYDRNLRNNPLKKECQNSIQIKWYSIRGDLAFITKMRQITNNYIKK